MLSVIYGLKSKRAQFKIQQMAFMMVFVVIFFVLVGMFVLQMNLGGMKASAREKERDQVMSALSSWSELSEFSCSDNSIYCIDEDKLNVLISSEYSRFYENFWPVDSITVYKINEDWSSDKKPILCPGQNCNMYRVYDSGKGTSEYGTYVSICKTSVISGVAYDDCELGLLSIGAKNIKD